MCGYTGYSQPVLSSSKKKTGDEVALNVKISEAQHQFFFDKIFTLQVLDIKPVKAVLSSKYYRHYILYIYF